MPTPTYTPIGQQTVFGGGTTTITFTNIPSTYKDLVLVATGTTSVNADICLRFNSDSATNYNFVYMGTNGTTQASSFGNLQTQAVLDAYAWRSTERATCIINIMNYSSTTQHRTIISRNNLGSSGVDFFGNRWINNTTAINRIDFIVITGGAVFNSLSTFCLYGIAG